MADKFLFDGIEVKQPDDFSPQWETTYTEATDRTMGGSFYGGALFTVESYACEFTNLTPEEASQILKIVVPTQSKLKYTVHYFSWYDGEWKTAEFYTGKGSLKIGTLKPGSERLDSISFNCVKVEKIV